MAFPDYGKEKEVLSLGAKLRLFGSCQDDLKKLNISDCLVHFTDYVCIKSIQPVPPGVTKFASFVRRHVKGKARIEKDERGKAMLWAKKSGKSLESCLEALAKTRPSSNIKMPFIWIESEGTKRSNPNRARKFPLFICKIEHENSKAGELNCYGLSYPQKQVTLPQF